MITSIGKFRNDNRTLLKITNGKTCAATNAVYENGRISVDINGVSDCTVISGIKSRVRIIGHTSSAPLSEMPTISCRCIAQAIPGQIIWP